jgi:hypothetical protein
VCVKIIDILSRSGEQPFDWLQQAAGLWEMHTVGSCRRTSCSVEILAFIPFKTLRKFLQSKRDLVRVKLKAAANFENSKSARKFSQGMMVS